ncbi:MAG: hypothetical protein K6C30_00810 [Bacteroidaceae bacterium]|nr:hypothetical protein [Bacteroidaceae bacterium]
MMNARNLMAAVLLVLPFSGWAQDDVYFVPKKKTQSERGLTQRQEQSQRYLPVEIIYEDDYDTDDTLNISGSSRDVDEYNRRRTPGSQLTGQLVENPDGSYTYRVPAEDTLYVMNDSTAITTEGFAQELYTRGYEDGVADGEDYAYSRRIGRFAYSDVYASPWYYSYYDPFYYDDWYYHPYHGYYGLYHWGYRPYWGYGIYDPYWRWNYGYYGGYYGWGGGYRYHGRTGRGGYNPRGSFSGSRGGGARGGRAGSYTGRAGVSTSRSGGVNINGGRATGRASAGRAGSYSTQRSSSTTQRSTTTQRSSTYTPSTSSRSSSTTTSRSSGSFGGGSSFGGGRAGGGGGGSRGGGGGGGRGGR